MRFGMVWGSLLPDIDLLISIAIIAFVRMAAYDVTGPPSDQLLLVYAAVGLPFLILILVLPWANRRILYAIPN